jgi:hypothetical protein
MVKNEFISLKYSGRQKYIPLKKSLYFLGKRFQDLGIRVSWYGNQDHCQAGEGSFCCKSLQNMFKNVFGPLAAFSQVYTFRAIQYIWVKNEFFTI